MKRIIAPFCREDAASLRCGETIVLSGVIYTARDAAHMRLAGLVERGEALPFPVERAVVYYAGPAPARPGSVIGSAGPTTSSRMDAFTPALIKMGLAGMIGKGARSYEVVAAIREYGAVYFAAIGGAGALMARCVESSEIVAYEELGAEAIRRLVVRDMPLTIAIDSEGNDIYTQGREDYLRFRD